jgi:hypothetical protein
MYTLCHSSGLVVTVRQRICVELSQQQLIAGLEMRETTEIITVQAMDLEPPGGFTELN